MVDIDWINGTSCMGLGMGYMILAKVPPFGKEATMRDLNRLQGMLPDLEADPDACDRLSSALFDGESYMMGKGDKGPWGTSFIVQTKDSSDPFLLKIRETCILLLEALGRGTSKEDLKLELGIMTRLYRGGPITP